jgi:hypothetical protein
VLRCEQGWLVSAVPGVASGESDQLDLEGVDGGSGLPRAALGSRDFRSGVLSCRLGFDRDASMAADDPVVADLSLDQRG